MGIPRPRPSFAPVERGLDPSTMTATVVDSPCVAVADGEEGDVVDMEKDNALV
jgi:hypothetical protein